MSKEKFTIKNEKDYLTWFFLSDELILKKQDSVIFSTPLLSIENIKVERLINPQHNSSFELVIEGDCTVLFTIALTRKNAFNVQKWFESNIEKTKTAYWKKRKQDNYHRYRPNFFRLDFIDSYWQVIAIVCIVILLLYIIFMVPRLNFSQNNQQDKQMAYDFLYKEGTSLIDQDRLTDGINRLEDAKNIKNTEEIQKALDKAYLERAQFYFDSKEYKKARLDIEQIKNRQPAAEKMWDIIERFDNTSPYFEKINVTMIGSLLRSRWNFSFQKETKKDNSNINWTAKIYDIENSIIFQCILSGISEDQINSIYLKSEMMQKDLKENLSNFETISKDFLSICYKIPFNIENQGLIESWFNQWYPKMSSSIYQVNEQISGIEFVLMGEKGVRVVDIKMAEVSKIP